MLTSPKKYNKTAIAVMIIAFVLAMLLLCLSAYTFDISVYTKKSSNTFKGDENYAAAMEDVNAVADEYREKGFDVTIDESFTERTNSKGETTSLAVFTVNESISRSGLAFLGSGFNSSWVLLAVVLCMALSLACAFAGYAGTGDMPYRHLDDRTKAFRTAAGILALAAVLLVPVFVMMNTYTFARKSYLYSNGLITDGKEEFCALVDAFLMDGAAGDGIESVIKGLTFKNTGTIWALIPCAAAMMLAAIQLRCGKIKPVLLKGLLYAFVIVVCVITLYPYYVMLITGFRTSAETNDMYFLHVFPTKWVWSNFSDIVARGVPKYLLNSLFIAGGATGIALLCGIPAAYTMARRNFKGKNVFLGFVIMSQMFSPVVLLIGIAQLMSTLKLNDSILGLMLINAAFNQAFAIWLLRGTFVSISPEMEQAALIDGCNPFQSLVKVLIPMAAPGIVTTLIFVFINAWNEYTISTVLISTAANRPITVGITQFSSFNMIEWQYLFAASLLATIPVVILFTCIEKHLTSGLTAGGVKG